MGNVNILWVDTKDLSIGFDNKPLVGIREILPSDDKFIKLSKANYPFILKRELTVDIFYHKKNKHYTFVIPKNFCYDGMTIPRLAWTLIGVSKEDNRGLIGSLIHDKLCLDKYLIQNDRELSTNVFKELIISGGIPNWKANIMCVFVDLWQRTQGW